MRYFRICSCRMHPAIVSATVEAHISASEHKARVSSGVALTTLWVLCQLGGQWLVQSPEDVLRDLTDIHISKHCIGHHWESLDHPVDVVVVHLEAGLDVVNLIEIRLHKSLPHRYTVWIPVVGHASDRVDASVRYAVHNLFLVDL